MIYKLSRGLALIGFIFAAAFLAKADAIIDYKTNAADAPKINVYLFRNEAEYRDLLNALQITGNVQDFIVNATPKLISGLQMLGSYLAKQEAGRASAAEKNVVQKDLAEGEQETLAKTEAKTGKRLTDSERTKLVENSLSNGLNILNVAKSLGITELAKKAIKEYYSLYYEGSRSPGSIVMKYRGDHPLYLVITKPGHIPLYTGPIAQKTNYTFTLEKQPGTTDVFVPKLTQTI